MLFNMSYPQEQQSVAKPVKPVAKAKQRSPPSLPFDPDELSRRLFVVLAEQKGHTEKKRRPRSEAEKLEGKAKPESSRVWASGPTAPSGEPSAPRPVKEKSPNIAIVKQARPKTSTVDLTRTRSAKDKSQRKPSKRPKPENEEYHHVPQVAAAQFARTTTADGMTDRGLVHKLSKKALNFHLGGLNADRSLASTSANAAPFQQIKALRTAQSHRERLYERNQFQHTQVLEAAAEEDEERDIKQQHRHTFEGPFGNRNIESDAGRRMSTGELLVKQSTGDSILVPAPVVFGPEQPVVVDPETVHEHRVDWTQSDELNQKPKSKISPLLRKADSIWGLRGRLGSFTKHGRDEKTASSIIEDTTSSTDSPKSPRVGFFARFKVNH